MVHIGSNVQILGMAIQLISLWLIAPEVLGEARLRKLSSLDRHHLFTLYRWQSRLSLAYQVLAGWMWLLVLIFVLLRFVNFFSIPLPFFLFFQILGLALVMMNLSISDHPQRFDGELRRNLIVQALWWLLLVARFVMYSHPYETQAMLFGFALLFLSLVIYRTLPSSSLQWTMIVFVVVLDLMEVFALVLTDSAQWGLWRLLLAVASLGFVFLGFWVVFQGRLRAPVFASLAGSEPARERALNFGALLLFIGFVVQGLGLILS